MITEPINLKSLATAFRAAHWRWYDGFPTAERLERMINEGKNYVSNQPPRYCSNSGGIDIKWLDGKKVVVFIDGRLAEHYQP
jgi:hypothetical protein